MSLSRKLTAFMALQPDVAVVQEVSSADIAAHPQSCWVGNLPNKGLGAFALNDFRIRPHSAWDPRIEFVVPIEVTGPVDFILIAVWAMHGRAVQRIQERPNRWQLLQALDSYEALIRSQPTVVAGDFNNAVQWDKVGKSSNHAVAVDRLESLGLASAYHAYHEVAQGRELDPTLYWTWNRTKTFHIDYIWLPRDWLPAIKRVDVGDHQTWVGGRLSDHVPLSVDIDESLIGRPPPGLTK